MGSLLGSSLQGFLGSDIYSFNSTTLTLSPLTENMEVVLFTSFLLICITLHLSAFTFISLHHSSTTPSPLLSSSSPSTKITISSANSNAGTCSSPHLTPTLASLSLSSMSLIYSKKSNGESTQPCLRPVVTSMGLLRTLSALTSHSTPVQFFQ